MILQMIIDFAYADVLNLQEKDPYKFLTKNTIYV